MSPLLAQSGHVTHIPRCPLLGVKRTLVGGAAMSAYDPKRTLPLFGIQSHQRGSCEVKINSARQLVRFHGFVADRLERQPRFVRKPSLLAPGSEDRRSCYGSRALPHPPTLSLTLSRLSVRA